MRWLRVAAGAGRNTDSSARERGKASGPRHESRRRNYTGTVRLRYFLGATGVTPNKCSGGNRSSEMDLGVISKNRGLSFEMVMPVIGPALSRAFRTSRHQSRQNEFGSE